MSLSNDDLTDFIFDENLSENVRKVFLKVVLFLLIFIWHCFSTRVHNNMNQAVLANAEAEAEAEAKIVKADAETKIAKADAEIKIVKADAEIKIANADAEKKFAKAEADRKITEMAFEIQTITMQLEKSVVKESQYTARALIEYVENFVIPPNKPNQTITRRDKWTTFFTTDSRGQAAYSCIVRANPIWSKGEQNIAERLTSFKVMHTMRLPMTSIADNFRSEKRSNDGAAL